MVTNQFLVPVFRTIFQHDNNKQIIFSTDQREESQTRYCESFSENDAVYAAHKLTQQTLAADSSWPNPRHFVPDTPCLLRNTPRSDLWPHVNAESKLGIRFSMKIEKESRISGYVFEKSNLTVEVNCRRTKEGYVQWWA